MSQKLLHGDISVTERGIKDPLVSKRLKKILNKRIKKISIFKKMPPFQKKVPHFQEMTYFKRNAPFSKNA